MKCKLCNFDSSYLTDMIILNKYRIKYYKCDNCGYIQTEFPFWLEEAYSNAISDLDIGLVSRNLKNKDFLLDILKPILSHCYNYLDYAGGYGLLVRMMRDNGYNFLWQDKYSDNLFSKNFDIDSYNIQGGIKAITAFEFIEHAVNPLEELREIFMKSNTLIFTTDLFIPERMNFNSWWYIALETGQHISFFQKKSLEFIASYFNKQLLSDNISQHILTSDDYFINLEGKFFAPQKKGLIQNIIGKFHKKYKENEKSLLNEDYAYVKKIMLENHRSQ